jgi:hypothetical protein
VSAGAPAGLNDWLRRGVEHLRCRLSIHMGANGSERTKIAHDPVETAIRELARRQSGNFSRQQLLAQGLGAEAIKARLRNGSLVTRYHGVYCQAPARHDPQARIAAAVLAGGPTAAASHASAAYLWGFLPHYEPPPEISLTSGDRRPRHIVSHRCPSLKPRDVTHQRGVPTTTRARTILDLAPRLTKKQLTRIVNDARRDGHLRADALNDILTRNPLHPGTKLLRPFVETTANPTNSGFEDDFLAFTEKYGLPTPLINVYVNGKQVDAYFPDHNLIVETDGWDYHKDRAAFEDDRERDAHQLAHGISTVRLTRERFDTTPDREANRLQTILDQQAARSTAYPKRPVT